MRWALLAIGLFVLSGCAQPANILAPPTPAPGPELNLEQTHEVPLPTGACNHCFSFEVPAGHADQDTWLQMELQWDGTNTAEANATVEGPTDFGNRLVAWRGFDASRIQVWAPTPGTYSLSTHVDGAGAKLWVSLEQVTVEALGERGYVPNLVTLAPAQVGIGACLEDEQIEDGAQRCLRMGNSVANVGRGPLEVHLDVQNAAASAAGLGTFVQRIFTDDGYRLHTASDASLHPIHGHFHYAGLAEFTLYAVDEETGLRAAQGLAGSKQGFCLVDWGPMESPEVEPDAGGRAEQACLVPNPDGWSMGMSPGWYDYYGPYLSEQYVEVSDVPDGLYELVSVSDPANTLEEIREDDNAASVLLRLEGDQVSIVQSRAFYANPEA